MSGSSDDTLQLEKNLRTSRVSEWWLSHFVTHLFLIPAVTLECLAESSVPNPSTKRHIIHWKTSGKCFWKQAFCKSGLALAACFNYSAFTECHVMIANNLGSTDSQPGRNVPAKLLKCFQEKIKLCCTVSSNIDHHSRSDASWEPKSFLWVFTHVCTCLRETKYFSARRKPDFFCQQIKLVIG